MVIAPSEHDPRKPKPSFTPHPLVAELAEVLRKQGPDKALARARNDLIELARQCYLNREELLQQWAKLYQARLRFADTLVFLEDAGLIQGYPDLDAFVAEHWPLK